METLYESTALLSSTYFGPVQWYQKLNRYKRCVIERFDNYTKQTYRNRCVIVTANGVQALTVPTKSYDTPKYPMRDIRISDHGEWRHLHWNAITSAYGESPFFDYYADDLRPFFEKHWEYLFDLNLEITHTMCDLLDIRPTIALSDEYAILPSASESPGTVQERQHVADFRDVIRPKHPQPDPDFVPRTYYQVYASRHGFLPNLSILDLLFNEGPEGVFYL